MRTIIKKPLMVSEKSSKMMKEGVYTFEVERAATKTEIKNEVETKFDVKVDSVRTLICRGRASRQRLKPRYWKKAYVGLKEGEQIKMFDMGAS